MHKRNEYHDLIRAIKNKAIDFVVVEKLDRLHRNVIESRKFIDLCDAMGVKFYRLDGGLVDLKDRSSRTAVFIESWIAEEYSLDLVEKLTKKGREARVNNGKDNNTLPVLGIDEHPTEACFYVINKEEQKIKVDTTDVHVYTDPFLYFVDVINGKIKVPENGLYSLENNVRVVQILDAARESAKSGKTISLGK